MTGNGLKDLVKDSNFGSWIIRLMLLCGILWTQLTYVPRSSFEVFVQNYLKDQEKRTDMLADIKERIARIDERQRHWQDTGRNQNP
jgi:hypothetical protein